LSITIINNTFSDSTLTPRHSTRSAAPLEGSGNSNFRKQHKPSFLHPNRPARSLDRSRRSRLAFNFNATKPITPRYHSGTFLPKRRLKAIQSARRLTSYKRPKFRRKPVRTLISLYFRNQSRRPQNLLKKRSYRNPYAGPKSQLFFRMFPSEDQVLAPTSVCLGFENSSFWFHGVHTTQFGSKSWIFYDPFLRASLLPSVISKAPTRDVRSLKTNFSPDHTLPFNYLTVVANAAKSRSLECYDSVPTPYSLWLTSTTQTHSLDTALFSRNFLTHRCDVLLQARLRPWTTHARKVNWLRYKSILLRHNVFLKKTARRIFSFYFYKVPTSFAKGRDSKLFIPELPSALRGSFWSESPEMSRLAITNLWQDETTHELSRTTPNRIYGSFSLPRVNNRRSTQHLRRSNFTAFHSIFINKLTHRHFKNTFYPTAPLSSASTIVSESNMFAYSTRKLIALPSANVSKPSIESATGLWSTLSDIENRVRRHSGNSMLSTALRLRSLRPLDLQTSQLAEFSSPIDENIQPPMKPLIPRISSKMHRNVRRRLRILKSRSRRRLRKVNWRIRLLTRARSRLRRNPPRRLRASKARKTLWRRSRKLLHSSLNLSKRPSKPKNSRHRNHKTRDNKSFYQTYRTALKQFNSKYSQSYKPVIGSLFLNEMLSPDLLYTDKLTSNQSIGVTVPLTRTPKHSNKSSQLASLSSHLPTLLTIWTAPTLLKYVLLAPSFGEKNLSHFENGNLSNFTVGATTRRLQNQLSAHFFGSQSKNIRKLNIWNVQCANFVLRKRLLRVSSNSLFLPDVTMWYYRTLVRFIENCTGRRVALHFGPFAEGALTFEDRAQVSIWSGRVLGFQKMLGHKIFAQEALMLITVAIRLKDPTFLANWIRGMLKRLSFWKYRLIFRYLKYVIRHLFKSNFDHFQFKGFKLRLKGKISVAGNARTRSLSLRVGDTSHSKMDNRVAYDLSYVGTFTGVLGFKLWFFY